MARAKPRGTRRSTINKRRKGAMSVIVPWMRRFGLILLAGVIGIWLGAWIWMSGNLQKVRDYTHDEVMALSASAGFKVENVLVEGRMHANAEKLVRMIDTPKGAPLFSFNPVTVRAQIETLDWVKYAQVERRLPDTIYIRLEEYAPLALWQKDKTLYLLGDDGNVIHTSRLAKFQDLMIVMGEDAPGHAPELLSNLQAEPVLKARVTSAKWMDGRRWDLQMKDGVTVKLPEHDMGLALRRLAEAQEEGGLLEKDIQTVDLREPERLIVRTRPGAMREYKAEAASLKAGDNI